MAPNVLMRDETMVGWATELAHLWMIVHCSHLTHLLTRIVLIGCDRVKTRLAVLRLSILHNRLAELRARWNELMLPSNFVIRDLVLVGSGLCHHVLGSMTTLQLNLETSDRI